ncbi:Zinc finger protein [Oopsacas minuta]|uniref:Zinc finger protein n=1 Tax=Oopsacas minuta TaxID=111878 RepID=A0AAV7KCW6_9METZ|nr:Zinc finger protein [Oopsacas minuta]
MADENMYSCMTCRLLVTNQELQREHYQSDWHRYNLKRKVASLPSVSLETFLEKASAHEALLLAAESVRKQTWKCEICKKHFACQKQLDNHLLSKKHITQANRKHPKTAIEDSNKQTHTEDSQPDDDIEESIDPEPLEENECLFCPIQSADRDKHLQHMYIAHGFFIPSLDYIKDIDGLLQLLAALIGENYSCLYCANRSFNSVEAAQHHMRDRSHCKLDFEDTEAFSDQLSDFYDFSTSYPDHEQNNDEHIPTTPRLTLADDMSLVLPSGAKIGHRAFKHIYKQNLRSSVSRAVVLAKPTVPSPAEYAMKLRILRERKQIATSYNKQQMRLGVKANKFQPFIRKQC